MHFKACIAVIFVFVISLKAFAQSEETEASRMKPQPPDKESYLYYEVWKMPEHYAQDFPLYTEEVFYHKFGYLPEMRKNIKMKDIRNAQITGYNDALKFMYLRELVTFAHKYNSGMEEKIKEWYIKNANQAGYKLVTSSVGSMKDVIEMQFQKTEGNIFKEVKLKIHNGKIDVTAYKDQPVETHKFKRPESDNEAKITGQQEIEANNEAKTVKPGKIIESDNN